MTAILLRHGHVAYEHRPGLTRNRSWYPCRIKAQDRAAGLACDGRGRRHALAAAPIGAAPSRRRGTARIVAIDLSQVDA